MPRIIVYTDGGSRGNPGPAGIGVVIKEPFLKEYGEYIGETTNNQAEYQAVVFALRKLKSLLGGKKAENAKVEVRVDSELVARQLNGEYKILDEDIQPLFIAVWNAKLDFKKVTFKSIGREENKEADRLVNQVLSQKLSKTLF